MRDSLFFSRIISEPVKFLRYAGDFRNQEEIRKWNRIADRLKKEGLHVIRVKTLIVSVGKFIRIIPETPKESQENLALFAYFC